MDGEGRIDAPDRRLAGALAFGVALALVVTGTGAAAAAVGWGPSWRLVAMWIGGLGWVVAADRAPSRSVRANVDGGAILLALAGGAGLAAVAALVTGLLAPWLDAPAPPDTIVRAATGPVDRCAVALAVVVVAPYVEERYFRGILLDALVERMGGWAAVAVSAALFAAVHMDRAAAPGLFVLGVGFGSLRLATGSLASPVVAHGMNNFLALFQMW